MKIPLIFVLVSMAWLTVNAGGPRKPKITDQKKLSVTEDGSITILLTDLQVRDPDDIFYPFGYTMKLYPGDNYSFSGHTVTPAPNFNGTLKVGVTVNDGYSDSDVYDLVITVTPVNDPPIITGQKELSTEQETPITISLNDLTVSDPDNTYPQNFTLAILQGQNYTASGTTLTPAPEFTGTLSVRITVNDGVASSPVFDLSVTVIPGNERPVITAQAPLSISKGQALTIDFSHLKVADPDNNYPQDFTLVLYPGENYTYSGLVVTPLPEFTGTLVVKVAVNDGNSTSEIFGLNIEVKDQITITSQKSVSILEDESKVITTDLFSVYDPNSQYPSGYLLKVDAGDNYTVDGHKISPAPDFFGELNIRISVTNGTYTSPVYNFKITVLPVNDPPRLEGFPEAPLRFAIGNDAVKILPEITVADPDDTHLILAEIALQAGTFTPGDEQLAYTPSGKINAVFDAETGTLTLVGEATLEEYAAALEGVSFSFADNESTIPGDRILTFKLNDGENASITYERTIVVGENFELDIPSVFTPNEDAANDTWKISPRANAERYGRAIIRVYSERGYLVFETSGFQQEWDGYHNGKLVPPGTYYYTIDLNLNYATNRIRGVVNLLR